MVPFQHATILQLQQVPAGHLFVLQVQAVPTLCIRASIGGGAVLFSQGGPPAFLDYQADPACLHLGSGASVRVQTIPGSLTPSTNARVPGNLAIIGGSTCLIARIHPSQVGFGGEKFVNVATGAVIPHAEPCWYVTNWSLGIDEQHGGFHELFRWPAPA